MLPLTFPQPDLSRTFDYPQPPAQCPNVVAPNDLASEQFIGATEPSEQWQPEGVLGLDVRQISRHGADIDTYRMVLKSPNGSNVMAIKVARVAEGDFNRRNAIHSLYTILGSEWCKLDRKSQNVSPGWMMGAKVAGVMAPAMVVPWYENGDVLAYLHSAQGVNPVDLAGQVASGLKHLHTLGVVHGNVYPGNVMITQQKKACLVDIGVRALMNRCFYSDSIPLTPAWRYKAPEELAEGDSYTQAADVYGFAGTVYVMVTLTPPFEHQTLGTGLQEIIKRGHCMLLDQSEHVKMSADLRCVLRECWSFKPVQRPEMIETVARFNGL